MLVKTKHFCPKTGEDREMEFKDDSTTLGHASMRAQYFPTKDEQGNPLEPEFGYFKYRDHQTAVLQEMPEHAPAGQLPRSVPVILDDDLVDAVKPGDRVQIVGVYRAIPRSIGGRNDGGIPAFRTVLIATNVQRIMRDASTVQPSAKDVANIRAVGAYPNVYKRMSESLAPSIFGNDVVKKALLLQLLGGVEKHTQSHIHLRGDIHLLLVGDPSTAKSQLLRFMLHVAPLAISTNARGASGVGLTAAIVADPDTHERALEAGAMVLADGGVVCIDEFDKMNTDDRAALHEVMEQQTVTIQKAGVHASLNARCSVLAAANPIYGSYNREKNVMQNIGFPSTLLSRFDALFIILDPADAKLDRAVADHVLRMHREGRHIPLSIASSGAHLGDATISNLLGGSTVVNLEETLRLTTPGEGGEAGGELDDSTPVFTESSRVTGSMTAEKISEVLNSNPSAKFSIDFIRKYVSFARKFKPAMTPDAGTVLVEAYAEFRQRSRPQPGVPGFHHATLPITARLLESMVRLSEAHARCRLAQNVSVEDANAAVALLKYALYSEGNGVPDEESAAAAAVLAAPAASNKQKKAKKAKKRKRGEELEDAVKALKQSVMSMMQDTDMIGIEQVIEKHHDLSRQQIEDTLLSMDRDGQLMYREGTIFSTL